VIDRTARTKLGELMRHWASGRITNWQFDKHGETATNGVEDNALREVFVPFAYQNEYNQYRFVGKHRLAKTERRLFARCILFLQNDADYYDPFRMGCREMLFMLLTLGVWKDRNYWARRQHELLCGRSC